MDDKQFLDEVLFPYEKLRENQKVIINDVYNILKEKKCCIIQAPTGIGKTASVLAPSLSFAINNGLTVMFLTSRHMQHQIVVKTLREMKEKHRVDIKCADIIGKKSMCLQSGIESLNSGDFHNYCRELKEKGQCDFFINTRSKNGNPTPSAKVSVEKIKMISPCNVHEIIEEGIKSKLCPYEIGLISAENSNVVICDYYYIFNDSIRQSLMSKIKKELGKCIIIIDEGHNLPNRIRELMTHRLSSYTVERALREAKKSEYAEAIENLNIIAKAVIKMDLNNVQKVSQNIVNKDDFIDEICRQKNYKDIVTELLLIGEQLLETQKSSSILSIAKFMEAWPEGGEEFSRIFSKNTEYGKDRNSIMIKCMDPSIISKRIINESFSTILMSGTLTPTSMYKDTLGFPDKTLEKEYASPFPKRNRKILIVTKTTTRFSKRTLINLKEIGEICADICNCIKGNVIIFFPSYDLMHAVGEYFKTKYEKIIFTEKNGLTKAEKEEFIEKFKSFKNKSAALLAVSTGSFGEGLDMPGILKGVIVVGLPLQRPDLETKELIDYYDKKFGKGWDYGYVLPAITKCIQNAGRCIRDEKDKGVIVFLDERYSWWNYYKCFPRDWNVRIENDYKPLINKFFEE